MIYAKFFESNNKIDGFVLSGHAESGPAGHDLVCAASSALAIGTTNNLYRMLSSEPRVNLNEDAGGFLELYLPLKLAEKQAEHAQVLLESLYYSLLDVQEAHGEYISVSKIKND